MLRKHSYDTGLVIKMDKIFIQGGLYQTYRGPFTMHLLPTEHFTHA